MKRKAFVTILSKHPISKEEIREALQTGLHEKEIQYVEMFDVLE